MVLVTIALLSACGAEEESNADLMITRAPEAQTLAQEPEAVVPETEGSAAAVREEFTFFAEGTELIPGTQFDPGMLPEADSIYQVPSCAIVGTDNVYNYGTFELTAFDDGESEVIYSILLLDPNITTSEGLALGDSVSRASELYGEDYTQEGTARIYAAENTLLCVIVQADCVVSIEYRMITE